MSIESLYSTYEELKLVESSHSLVVNVVYIVPMRN